MGLEVWGKGNYKEVSEYFLVNVWEYGFRLGKRLLMEDRDIRKGFSSFLRMKGEN